MSSAAPARALVYRFGEQRRAHLQFAAFNKSPEYTLVLQSSFLRERPKFLQNKNPLRIGT
jgi:hypothetical protein